MRQGADPAADAARADSPADPGPGPGPIHHLRAGRITDRPAPCVTARPAPGDATVEIAFSLDAALVDVFPTTLRSVTFHTSAPLRITLLTRGIDGTTVAALSRAAPDVAVAWFPAEALHYAPLQLLGHTTISTMDRLWLPRLVDWTDRMVYLDIDVALTADIALLHGLDLGGRPLAARPSLHPDWRTGMAIATTLLARLPPATAAAFTAEFGGPEGLAFPCFNAGVLLLDLAALRAGDFSGHTLRLAATYGIHDQYAINLFCRGNFTPLPPTWNHFVGQEELADPALIHYAGLRKPWLPGPCPRRDAWQRHRPAAG